MSERGRRGRKRQQDEKGVEPLRRSERLRARQRQEQQGREEPNDAASKPEKRDLEAEERVFEISLLRSMILRYKVELEYWVRRDGDIRQAVKEWLDHPVAAERRYGHISDWDVSRVTDMSELFMDDDDFNEDLSRWQTGNVKNMSRMFCGATSFTSDLSRWQTGKVTDMCDMFDGARSLQDVPHWGRTRR